MNKKINKAPLATKDRTKPQWTRKRWFAGYKGPGDLDVFPCYYTPTAETHKPPYGFVDGPYRTKKAATDRALLLGGRRR